MFFDHLGEIGVFRQEAVAGMNRVGVGDGGGGDDRRLVQIGILGRGRADAHRFVGQTHMHGVMVGGGMHRDRLDTHLAAGAMDAKGDLAAIGDEDFAEHYSMMTSGSPYSTGEPSSTRIWVILPALAARIGL